MSFKIKLFLACLVSLAGAAQAQERAEPFVPGELIIGYNSPGDRDAAIGELNAPTRQLELRGRALESVQAQPMGENALKLRIEADGQITTRSAANPQAQLQALQDVARTIKERDSRVKYAHPNWLLTIKPPSQNQALDLKRLNTLDTRPKHQKPSLPNDPVFAQGLHWHYQPLPVGMNAVGAWRQAKGTREVTVAVLDTGVLPDHPDVKGSGNLLPGYNFVSIRGGRRGVGAADPGDACKPSDKPSWHGSHVAGTIGSVSSNNGKGMTGINWNVSVLPLRVLAACGGSIGDISDAIRWAAGLPVQGVDQVNAHPAQIINMSLGGPGSCTLDRVGLLI